MNHEESRSLLGAYALDAVPEDEAQLLEEHLASCPRCRHELSVYLESAVALGSTGREAPDGLWQRIAAGLEEQPPPLRLVRQAGVHRRAWSRAAIAVAGVAAAAIAFLGWDVAHLDAQVGHLQSAMSRSGLVQAAQAAALSPNSRHVVLTTSRGSDRTEVVIAPGGQAFVLSSDLPRIGGQMTYQLWGLAGRRLVSLGLLGQTAAPSVFRVNGRVSALMITVEPAGGVPAPTTPVVVRATL